MIQLVHFFRLGETIVNIFLHIETIHEGEFWWLSFIKKFLLESIGILSIVYNNFAVLATSCPLIVRFQEGDPERVDRGVQRDEVVNSDAQGFPGLHEDQEDLPIFSSAQDVSAAGENLEMGRIVGVGGSSVFIFAFFFRCAYETSTHVSGGLHVEEAEVTVGEGRDEDGFEGVGDEACTFFLWNHEVCQVFLVEHVPGFHSTVVPRARNYVVLVELVEFFRSFLLGLEFARGHVLEVDCLSDSVLGDMTGLQLDGSII